MGVAGSRSQRQEKQRSKQRCQIQCRCSPKPLPEDEVLHDQREAEAGSPEGGPGFVDLLGRKLSCQSGRPGSQPREARGGSRGPLTKPSAGSATTVNAERNAEVWLLLQVLQSREPRVRESERDEGGCAEWPQGKPARSCETVGCSAPETEGREMR